MKNLPQALIAVLALVWLYGVGQALFETVGALRSAESYFRTEGEILGVEKHTDSYNGSVWHRAEVSFQYGVGTRQLRASSLTPLCTQCTPQEVLQVLHLRPSQVPAGMKVAVWVLKSDPRTAYLALPGRAEVIRQGLFTIGLLIAGVVFFACQFRVWRDWEG